MCGARILRHITWASAVVCLLDIVINDAGFWKSNIASTFVIAACLKMNLMMDTKQHDYLTVPASRVQDENSARQ